MTDVIELRMNHTGKRGFIYTDKDAAQEAIKRITGEMLSDGRDYMLITINRYAYTGSPTSALDIAADMKRKFIIIAALMNWEDAEVGEWVTISDDDIETWKEGEDTFFKKGEKVFSGYGVLTMRHLMWERVK